MSTLTEAGCPPGLPGIHRAFVVPGQGHTGWTVAFPGRWDGAQQGRDHKPGTGQTGWTFVSSALSFFLVLWTDSSSL